jgi:hypothetical protein
MKTRRKQTELLLRAVTEKAASSKFSSTSQQKSLKITEKNHWKNGANDFKITRRFFNPRPM